MIRSFSFSFCLSAFAVLSVGCAASAEEEQPLSESAESELTKDGNQSHYTDISEKNCFIKVNESDEMETSDSYCGGRGGYTLHILDADLRQYVSLVNGKKSTELNNIDVSGGAFTHLGPRVEWRSSQKAPDSPFALIFRQFRYDGELNKDIPMLVVAKLSDGGGCIFDAIDASKHKDANQRARDASNASIKGACPKAPPQPH